MSEYYTLMRGELLKLLQTLAEAGELEEFGVLGWYRSPADAGAVPGIAFSADAPRVKCPEKGVNKLVIDVGESGLMRWVEVAQWDGLGWTNGEGEPLPCVACWRDTPAEPPWIAVAGQSEQLEEADG